MLRSSFVQTVEGVLSKVLLIILSLLLSFVLIFDVCSLGVSWLFLIHLEQPNLQSKSISCDFLSACPLGDLNLVSVDGHKAIAFFCPRGGKKKAHGE